MRAFRAVEINGYKLGNLNGEAIVTWLENERRRRFRLGKEIDSQAEAEAALQTFVRQRVVLQSRTTETVASLFDAYCKDKEIEGKDLENQKQHWKALKPMFGHMSPDDVDKVACFAYRRRREKQGRSAGTIWTELTALGSFLGWAAKADLIDKKPYIWMPEKPPARDKFVTREQAQALIDSASHQHIKLFIIIALQTAGRMGAILDLTWDRVDFDLGRINLHDPSRQTTTKGRALLPMSGTAHAALLDAQQYALSPYVIEWLGRRVRDVKKGLKQTAKDAGLPWVSAHVLRHSAARWMAEAGVPMSEIAQYLGHTNSRITERTYARYSPEYLQGAAKALELPQRPVRLLARTVVAGEGVEPPTSPV